MVVRLSDPPRPVKGQGFPLTLTKHHIRAPGENNKLLQTNLITDLDMREKAKLETCSKEVVGEDQQTNRKFAKC